MCCIKSGLAPRDQQDVAEEKGSFYPLRSLAKNDRKKGFFLEAASVPLIV